ncbi:major facilitator superfamily domain-containing protein [Suillus fuscotomentosus]|uniref:Major facilitator superfamily domain-containing protein n=1 Tax=Suillus fuscotomentosus TaxID=1912939 RepID=A0AAD4HJ98_9AGAM|nr:major facilitator superfamily domain-containing protein [Suillus fuscotomentosus]KAG1898226.1 major facilitator superfamily domain-containing protein [Suillus fuscotomentosus]
MIESQSTTLSSTELQSVEFRETNIQTHVSSSTLANEPIKLDIEHAVVEDDPRMWSNAKKNVVLFIISGASMIAGLCANIQNPANAQIEQQLHTNGENISLSLSLFILVQGNFPVMWSAISEIKGRKMVYLFSIALFTLGSVIVAISRTIGLLIGMRILQGAGSSAVIAIGAATLADIYEPHQRGKMMGVFYSAPLLGPSLGPIIGGALTQGLGWRAIFWFLVIWGGIIFSAFLFLFKDTFRKERSVTYQNVLKRRLREQQSSEAKDDSRNISEKELRVNGENQTSKDIEAQPAVIPALAIREVKLSIADVNPFPPYLSILNRKNNFVILIPSGLIFAFSFSIAYTCARTLSMYYNYDALKTGLVLLAYGIGSVTGSILGGRWSDRTLARLKAANGGVSFPEMRLESTKVAMVWLPLSVIGYAWVCQERVNVAAICVMLFLAGFLSIWIYTSTLAYIVDANTGRSSTAVATNSSFRGLSAFVAAEIAIPLQDSIGDGGLYTLWAGLLVIANCIILLVLYKGRKWREASVEREKQKLDGK